MPVQERERLAFYTDLFDPKSVYSFPEEFVGFLRDHERDFDAQQFLSMVTKYMDTTPVEDLQMETICAIASMYADIYDVSGVPFDENPFLSGEEKPSSESKTAPDAEEVLLDLDRDVPRPRDVQPGYPDVVLEVSDDNSLEQLVYCSIVELRRANYRKAADQLAREIRQSLREEPTALQILRIIMSYVDVEVALEGD